ncbi:MAG: hypothetical protein OCD01_17820 [Fibrobacterales bacterium]
MSFFYFNGMTQNLLLKLVFVLTVLVSTSFGKLTAKDSLKLVDGCNDFFETIKRNNLPAKPGLLEKVLTEESIEWFEDIVNAVESDDSAALASRPFFESVSIIGLRYYYKNGTLEDLELPNVFKFYMRLGYVKKVFRMKNWANAWVEQEEYGFRGLKKAPRVPILHFRLENEQWRFELPQTLEIVSRSVLSLAQKKGWTNLQAALETLDLIILKDVIDEKLLEP